MLKYFNNIIRISSPYKAAQKFKELKAKLLAMNPPQRDIQLDAITQVIEGSQRSSSISLFIRSPLPPPPKKFRPIKALKPSNPPQNLPEIPILIKNLPFLVKLKTALLPQTP
ncbi:hypothetical protein VP01_2455g5 [Puccinia sorghi]|uniref:Uncharacterized protein n=1 Tax=Puccinia sorghi TaxID=27349 RepID=A0A0L6V6S8_9BASI|nr:hypothetical protein VP01_2455g5 [Puccinia sorghi]